MAALLVSIAAMGILMSVAMPAWRQAARREKEAQFVFRVNSMLGPSVFTSDGLLRRSRPASTCWWSRNFCVGSTRIR